ncbi:peptidase M50 [Fistulina hepatica ATCC 64428]|uniref:Endopeptidase S2P n=1 Tax=Fistulina hepatica ATCC 64428 TaxID=1128425 RepID=A0A0D7ALN4_9AGAR|nr:peptidase M50 [Fistulina hepatica ATCC 64428]
MASAIFLLFLCEFKLLLPYLGGVASLGTTNSLSKRVFTAQTEPSSSSFDIKPIIPGFTVPTSHIVYILLAVFASQIVHEMGHAFAATIEQVPVTSAGFSLLVVIPSAFVSMTTTAFDTVSSRARLRIIAAGPWHNALLFATILVAKQMAGWVVSYEDVGGLGLFVAEVDAESALHQRLPIGSIITALDDTPMARSSVRSWNDFFTAPEQDLADTWGWCINPDFYNGSRDCCDSHTTTSPLSCFTSVSEQRCVDPVPIMTSPASSDRCQGSTLGCSDGQIDERVLLWQGEKSEVQHSVVVDRYRPRHPIYLKFWPEAAVIFVQYLEMATISLYLFNLLPLPRLDGEQLLKAFLDLISNAPSPLEVYDVEALQSTDSRPRQLRWRMRIWSGVRYCVSVNVGFSLVLATIKVYKG